jgi:signal transduction histidine kinase
MLHVLGCITDQHDLRLVVLAALLCAFSCWTAVSLVTRAGLNTGRIRLAWTLASGGVFGAGVWGTHFIAMLAYQSPFFIGYGILLTLASILVAAVFSAIGFGLILRNWAIAGGAVVGLAISAMHYTGMAALAGPFALTWDMSYVVPSVVVAVLFGAVAAFVLARRGDIRGRVVASVLFTLGIVSLHFTAMTAVLLVPDPAKGVADAVMVPGILALAIAAVAVLIVSLGLVSAWLDSHLSLRRSDEEKRLRAYIEALEMARAGQEKTAEELRAALAHAEAANSAKSAFLAAMSHELRTPLNAVIGFSDLLLGRTVDDARRDEYVTDIRESGQKLLALVNDILDLARLDTGQLKPVRGHVALKDLLDAAMAGVASAARDGGVTVLREFEEHLPIVDADARLLLRAFGNLLSNAVKFTPRGGRVSVSALRKGHSVMVQIADTGIGIAQKDIARALERFSQLDGHLTRSYEGAGLGLPLANDFIALHGGSLGLESALGEGTTVTVTLPAVVAEQSALAAE